jgi:peptide/nickel transport system ATP-binding protein/oligopeptide transport system ATP-binding protein
MPPHEVLLGTEKLCVTFGTQEKPVRAVREVSLAIRPGEVVALVGESGSGKSTIGHALMGLFGPDDSVELRGAAHLVDKHGRRRDLVALSQREFRSVRGEDVAMIFQEPLSSLNPVFSIGTQVVEAIRTHRSVSVAAARERAMELLGELGLPNPSKVMENYPHQISGGMRQRVMIAMALACEPSLLIADEPTTALDVTIQAQIVDLLKRMQAATGMAILFITHDLGLVAEIADRAYVMYAGQIVETGTVRDLFAAPHHPYTRALLETRPMLGCSLVPGYQLRPIAGQAPSPARLPEGCAFAARCPHARPVCANEPALEALADGRCVRCLRWRELSLPGAA